MKKSISNKYFYYLIGIILIIVFWELLAFLLKDKIFILPGFFKTLAKTISLLGSRYTFKALIISLKRMLIGFVLGFLLGLILGIIAGNNEKIELILKPIMVFLRSLPIVSIIYLFILLFRKDLTPLMIIILFIFPINYEIVLKAIKEINIRYEKLLLIDGGSYLKNNLRIKLPLIKNAIISGISSTFSLSMKIEIMAEIISGSSSNGLGSLILASRNANPFNMLEVFAYSLIAILLMLLIDLLILTFKKIIKV